MKIIEFFEKNKKITWSVIGFLFLFIFYMSSRTFEYSGGRGFSFLPTIYHIFIFFLLSFFLFIAVLERKFDCRKIFLVFFISGIYAVLDEVHQMFVPGRFPSVFDVFLDFLGILLAFLIYFVLFLRKQQL